MMRMMMRLGALAGSLLAIERPTEAANIITNGNFSSTYSNGTESASTPSQLGYNGYGVTGWTNDVSNGYNFLFNPYLSGSAGYSSTGQYGTIQLYTSANGGSATAPASLVSPVGSNFLAASGAFQQGTISQTVNNLAVGQQYDLAFDWAAGQQASNSGTTTASWAVTFGAESYSTPTATTPSQGFSPWTISTHSFTATATSQDLSFLAVGGPSEMQMPFVLLDGVTLTPVDTVATPEPSTLILAACGVPALLGWGYRRSRRRTIA